jgi:cytochrome P450
LSGETLQSFAPRMEAKVLAHLAEFWEGKEQVKAVSSIKHFAFQLSCELFLSLKDGPELKKLEAEYKVLLDGLMTLPINLPGFRFHKSLAACSRVLAYFDTCILRRREVTSFICLTCIFSVFYFLVFEVKRTIDQFGRYP